jgi:hypothetical protein
MTIKKSVSRNPRARSAVHLVRDVEVEFEVAFQDAVLGRLRARVCLSCDAKQPGRARDRPAELARARGVLASRPKRAHRRPARWRRDLRECRRARRPRRGSRCSLSDQLEQDEEHDSAAEPATEQEVEKRPTSGGENRSSHSCGSGDHGPPWKQMADQLTSLQKWG